MSTATRRVNRTRTITEGQDITQATKLYWGHGLGWLTDEQALEIINNDFDKYIRQNYLKFSTDFFKEHLRTKLIFRAPYTQELKGLRK